jgi:uncharacterized SAM-binding protein YcdF (DUF218 family)
MESSSTSTRENAVFSIELAKQHGLRSFLIATNTFHQLRSLLVFRKVLQEMGLGGSRVYVAEVPFTGHRGWGGGPLLNHAIDQLDFWREIAALVYYWLKGYI